MPAFEWFQCIQYVHASAERFQSILHLDVQTNIHV